MTPTQISRHVTRHRPDGSATVIVVAVGVAVVALYLAAWLVTVTP